MARKRKYKKRKKDLLDYLVIPRFPSLDLDPDVKRSIYILIMIILGALGVLAMFDAAGMIGFYISLGLEMAFGWGRFVIPFAVIFLGLALFLDNYFELRFSNYFGLFLLLFSLQTLMQFFVSYNFWPTSIDDGIGGGYVGLFIAQHSFNIMGPLASWISFVCLFIISLILTDRKSVV